MVAALSMYKWQTLTPQTSGLASRFPGEAVGEAERVGARFDDGAIER